MKNLHLKTLIHKPNGLIILKKLNNRNYPYDEYIPYEYIPTELIEEIDEYIKSLKFKNIYVKDFISDYVNNLKNNNIITEFTVTKQIITLLTKYKLNELDVDSEFNFEKVNDDIKTHQDQIILNNKTEIIYKTPTSLKLELEINNNQEKNKISEISYIAFYSI